MFGKKKIQALEKENLQLKTQLETLVKQTPQIQEISKLLQDLQRMGGGFLSISRVPADEIYRWRAE